LTAAPRIGKRGAGRAALQPPKRVARRQEQPCERRAPLSALPSQRVDGEEAYRAAELAQRPPAFGETLLARSVEDPQPRLLDERHQLDVVPRGDAAQQMEAAQVHPGFGRIGNQV